MISDVGGSYTTQPWKEATYNCNSYSNCTSRPNYILFTS